MYLTYSFSFGLPRYSSQQTVDEICDAIGSPELITFASMSEAFDEESTRQESCDINDNLPTAETLQNEALVVLQSALPELTENDLPSVESIGDFQNAFGSGILEFVFEESVLLDDIGVSIRDMALSFWNDAVLPTRTTDFITSCYSTSNALLDCRPRFRRDPLTLGLSREIPVTATSSAYGFHIVLQASISFEVLYSITEAGSFEVSYSIEISIPSQTLNLAFLTYELPEVGRSFPSTTWFNKSVPAAQTIKDLVTQSIQTKIENVARQPVEDCYIRECRLDTKVSSDGAAWSRVAFR